jgi:tetratricopeptide (TPR) repeat protein
MFSFVLLIFAWVIQIWNLGPYVVVMPALGMSCLMSVYMLIKTAPLCNNCKKRPWLIFKRSAICCFAEKVSLRKTVQRTLKTFGVLYIVGGLATMYIVNVIDYGKRAKKYVEDSTRRPSHEKFIAERTAIEKLIQENPQDGKYILQLGWLYYRTGNLRAAGAQYTKAANLDPENPNPDAMLMEAIILGDMGQMLQEEHAYEKLLDLQPENTEALINVGLIYLRNKLADRAVERLDKANKLLLEKVTAEDNKFKLQYKNSEEKIPEDTPELKSMKLHLAISFYHLAVANNLIQETRKSDNCLRMAKRYGMNTDNFLSDVSRFKK